LPRGNTNGAPASPFTAWEEWFRRAAAGTQSEMLALADRQGFLSLHQLPPLRDAPHREALPESGLLSQLLAGQTPPLPVISCEPAVDQHALALARVQSAADVVVIQRSSGNPRTAPLLADVLRDAVKAGRRVLFVAPTLPPLERVLSELAHDASCLAVRFTAAHEKAANGPLTRFALHEQRQSLRSFLSQGALEAQAETERRRQHRAAEAALWPALDELLVQHGQTSKQLDELHSRLAGIAEEVRRDAVGMPGSARTFPSGPFAVQLALRLVRQQHRSAELEQKLRVLDDQSAVLEPQLVEIHQRRRPIEPMVDARRAGRWWTLAYWRAMFRAAELAADIGLEAQQRRLQAEWERAQSDRAALNRALEQIRSEFDKEREELIDSEVGRRRTELGQQIAETQSRLDSIRTTWQSRIEVIAEPADRPAEITPAAVENARQGWLTRRSSDDSGTVFAQQWARYLSEALDGLVERLPRMAPILVGTTTALASEPDFAAAAGDGTFDLLIVEDADRFAPGDLAKLAERACRWLLVGDAGPADVRSCPTRTTPFHKLWGLLHPTEPRPVYSWSASEEHLVCTLGELRPEDSKHVESERLADFPEIELRILVRSGVRPKLVQVLFPATMRLGEAKAFIYRELQEAAVDRLDRPLRWEETEGAFVLHLSNEDDEPIETLELESGLVESVCAAGAERTTCRFSFAKAAGWTCARVQEWCRRYLGFLDTGRTIDLT
jgi:hypothetical protein